MSLTIKQKINSVKYFLTHPEALKMILSFKESGYLYEVGWFRSLEEKKPVDKDGNPIPWFTYPAIDFLKDRLNKNMVVFEYGSGNSTLFFAERVKEIISVETDKIWYRQITQKLPSNARVIYFDENALKTTYEEVIKSANNKFDLIIVDGIYRNECIRNSLSNLSAKGIIILDDSERDEYKEGIDFLTQNNFNQLDFWGPAPIIFNKKCTSIFYYSNNCIGI